MELTQDDHGSHRAVRVGEHVTVALPENPTTGYRWHPEVDEQALRQLEDHFESASGPPGAPGTRRMTFTPLHSGAIRLRLANRRRWQSEPLEHFEVVLDADE